LIYSSFSAKEKFIKEVIINHLKNNALLLVQVHFLCLPHLHPDSKALIAHLQYPLSHSIFFKIRGKVPGITKTKEMEAMSQQVKHKQ
jgi:hypothetical protein